MMTREQNGESNEGITKATSATLGRDSREAIRVLYCYSGAETRLCQTAILGHVPSKTKQP